MKDLGALSGGAALAVEQRRARRYDVEIAVEVYTIGDVHPASTRNLSESGVCLDLSEELEESSVVGISMFLVTDGIEDPDAEPLNIKAEVVWCTERDAGGYSAGMRFAETGELADARIKEFLAALE